VLQTQSVFFEKGAEQEAVLRKGMGVASTFVLTAKGEVGE
jgi:hypothetical protein